MRCSLAFPAWLKASGLAAAVTLTAATVQAQTQAQRTLQGTVTDTNGRPLANAEVRIMDLGRVMRTDTTGYFAFTRITSRIVDVTIRRLGYEIKFVRVSMMNGEGDSLRVVMRGEPVRLANVDIEAQAALHPNFAEFEQRRSRGIGMFLTKADIDRLNSSYASDAFRSLPGMRLIRVNGGTGVRFMSTQGMRSARGGECQPLIWVDGQAAPGMEIDDIRAHDIYGVEIYRGASTTPVQFATGGAVQCGVIAVWTRRRGK